MRIILFVVMCAAAGVVLGAALPMEVPEPLELKLIGDTECDDGWLQIGERERGVTVWYQTETGSSFPNWISWERFAAHFHGTDPVTLEGVNPAMRITCRWNPTGADPA